MNMLEISSKANEKYKFLNSLRTSKVRKQQQLTVIEGEIEINMAMQANIQFRSVFVNKKIGVTNHLQLIRKYAPNAEYIVLSEELYAKVTYRENTEGVIIVAQTPQRKLSDFTPTKNSLILVIDGVEKPGNLGAMLRTADACAVDAVICCKLPTDIHHPNIVRSSLGTVFTLPVIEAEPHLVMQWLEKNNITTYCTYLHKSEPYTSANFTQSTAIVMGTESTGISKEWLNFSNKTIKIPMRGKIDSMNVSVAAAVILFEVLRQRM